MMTNAALWDAVATTPPEHTKPITGKAYKGTSPRPQWLVRKATETFGPCGIGWGFTFTERVEAGAGDDRLHIAHVRLWYVWQGKRGEVEHIGQTMFSGKRKSGDTYTDEDAPKKSVTDALVKALSLIGFAGDIFMGRYDDSRYVVALEEEQRKAALVPSNVLTEALAAVAGHATKVSLRAWWSKERRGLHSMLDDSEYAQLDKRVRDHAGTLPEDEQSETEKDAA